jgi:hypothetical protein
MEKPKVYSECQVARHYWDKLRREFPELTPDGEFMAKWEEGHRRLCEVCNERDEAKKGTKASL